MAAFEHVRAAVMGSLASLALAGPAHSAPDDQEAITAATSVVAAARERGDFCLGEALEGAEGVVVFSNIVSWAFIIGGQGGRGLFVRRAGEEPWRNPSFVRLNALNFGLAGGGAAIDVLAVLNADVAGSLAEGRMKLTAGAAASVVAGEAGGSATNLTNVGPGVRYYIIDSTGLFAGASLGGARIRIDDDANERFYAGANTKHFEEQTAATPEQAAALIAELGASDPSGCSAPDGALTATR